MKKKPDIKCIIFPKGWFAFYEDNWYRFLEWNTVQIFYSLEHFKREYDICPSDEEGYSKRRVINAYKRALREQKN